MGPAWRSSLAVHVCVAIIALAIEIGLLCSAVGKDGARIGILQRGDCEETEKLALVSYGIINILSTLLLGACNYTMQILAAPSRQDVNIAHGRGIPLSIGCQSLGNLKFVGGYRGLLWSLLVMSSVTLHLV